jgi:plasmid maintenance system antidote protein VapI
MKKEQKKKGKVTNDDGSFMALLNQYDSEAPTPGRIAKSFRVNSEFTLKEVSLLTDIPDTNLSKLENNKLSMTSQYAERIAAVYGVHPAIILYPEGYSDFSDVYMDISKQAQKLRREKEAI